MNRTLEAIFSLAVEALRKRRALRLVLALLSTLGLGITLFFYLSAGFWEFPIQQAIRDLAPALVVCFGAGLFVVAVSYTSLDFGREGEQSELSSLRQQRALIQERLTSSQRGQQAAEETVYDTIQLSLNQITEYYTINKSQARNSFRLSVFAIVVGLATLIGGIWLFYYGENPDARLAFVSGVAGVLVQFIGGAYFYLHNKSLSQLNFFYEKLVKMQDTMLAVQLSETLDREQETAMK